MEVNLLGEKKKKPGPKGGAGEPEKNGQSAGKQKVSPLVPPEVAEAFTALMMPAMKYTADRLGIPNFIEGSCFSATPADSDAWALNEAMFGPKSLLPDWLREHPELPEEDAETVRRWAQCSLGPHLLLKERPDGGILIKLYNNKYGDAKMYLVKTGTRTWHELVGPCGIPCIVHAALLPFRGYIMPNMLVAGAPLDQKAAGLMPVFMLLYSFAVESGYIVTEL